MSYRITADYFLSLVDGALLQFGSEYLLKAGDGAILLESSGVRLDVSAVCANVYERILLPLGDL